MENGEELDPIGLSILNVGEGDFKITFDKDNPGELERAKAVLTDMFKRGYVIMIPLPNGKTKKVKRFDPNTMEYIVKDIPKESASPVEERFPADKTPAIAIPRTARGCAKELW